MRVPVENKGKMPIYVAGVMIPPGEIRHFEDDMLPPEFRAPAVAEEAIEMDPLVELLAMNVAQVVLGLAALTDEELARLEVLESEGKQRKGVAEGIAEEMLRRAELKVGNGSGDSSGSGDAQQGGEL